MGKWCKRCIIFAIILASALVVISCGSKSESNATYDIVGTYRGNFSDHAVYYVFEPSGLYCIYQSGVPSVIIDEGTYESQGNGIFALESVMEHEHTVVCGNHIIYDFNMLNKEVCFADKTTEEIVYVNLPREKRMKQES